MNDCLSLSSFLLLLCNQVGHNPHELRWVCPHMCPSDVTYCYRLWMMKPGVLLYSWRSSDNVLVSLQSQSHFLYFFSTNLWSWSITLQKCFFTKLGMYRNLRIVRNFNLILLYSSHFQWWPPILNLGQISGWPTSLFWRVIEKTLTGRNCHFSGNCPNYYTVLHQRRISDKNVHWDTR